MLRGAASQPRSKGANAAQTGGASKLLSMCVCMSLIYKIQLRKTSANKCYFRSSVANLSRRCLNQHRWPWNTKLSHAKNQKGEDRHLLAVGQCLTSPQASTAQCQASFRFMTFAAAGMGSATGDPIEHPDREKKPRALLTSWVDRPKKMLIHH